MKPEHSGRIFLLIFHLSLDLIHSENFSSIHSENSHLLFKMLWYLVFFIVVSLAAPSQLSSDIAEPPNSVVARKEKQTDCYIYTTKKDPPLYSCKYVDDQASCSKSTSTFFGVPQNTYSSDRVFPTCKIGFVIPSLLAHIKCLLVQEAD